MSPAPTGTGFAILGAFLAAFIERVSSPYADLSLRTESEANTARYHGLRRKEASRVSSSRQ